MGELVMHIEAVALKDGHRWLYLYGVEPRSRSEKGLRLLGSLAATQERERAAGACITDGSQPAPDAGVVSSSAG